MNNEFAPLFNVNKIVVKHGLEEDYIKFSKKLNKYLQKKYEKYYIGLELYENKKHHNNFYVIAAYKDRRGIEKAAVIIGDDIRRIYEKVWGDKADRLSIFTFLDNKLINSSFKISNFTCSK